MSGLAEYLKQTGESQTDFARRIGATQSLVCRWLAGSRRPGVHFALAIERVTAGRVPVSAWDKRRRATRSLES